jgi:hypothetical protein
VQVRVCDMIDNVRIEIVDGEHILWLRSRMLPTEAVCELGVALEQYERGTHAELEEARHWTLAGDVPRQQR